MNRVVTDPYQQSYLGLARISVVAVVGRELVWIATANSYIAYIPTCCCSCHPAQPFEPPVGKKKSIGRVQPAFVYIVL